VSGVDPVLVQRERVRRIADTGKRVGYVLLLASMVLFFVALATNLATGVAVASGVCLIAGCVVLAPAILLGYAVKGAERDEEERGGR